MENKPDQFSKTINRERAIEVLDDGGEHKFLVDVREGPVYVVGVPREKEINPRLHEHLREDMLRMKIFDNPDQVRGGYCRVEENKLFYWGESSYPVKAATERLFDKAVDENGIVIIDQWLGKNSKNH